MEGQLHLKVLFPHHLTLMHASALQCVTSPSWQGRNDENHLRAVLQEGDLKVFSSLLFIRSHFDKQPRLHHSVQLS